MKPLATPSRFGPPVRPSVQPVTPAPAAPSRALPVMRLDSRSLFRGAQEVEIAHDMQVYRLRLTALGKLILTK
jgi:hemin uptake protein HemP